MATSAIQSPDIAIHIEILDFAQNGYKGRLRLILKMKCQGCLAL